MRKKNWPIITLVMIATVIIMSNFSVAEIIYGNCSVSPKVLKSAEDFLRVRFPTVTETIGYWQIDEGGFFIMSTKITMRLKWNGDFVIQERGVFIRPVLFEGDWTQ